MAVVVNPGLDRSDAGFFFIEKKDGSLRPCIDYRDLNALTVRQPYPLPLVPVTLEQLREARVFTKLALCSAYNLFSVTYQPGAKNSKADAHRHDPISTPSLPKPILPSLVMLTPFDGTSWRRSSKPRSRSLHHHPVLLTSSTCPPRCALKYCGGCMRHPVRRNRHLPSLSQDVEEYVESCATCTQSWMSHQLPTGPLEPLPIPRQPWSQMAVDFITNLPDSGGLQHDLGGDRPFLQSLPAGATERPAHSHGNCHSSI
ncbi:hypothetical protein QTP86_012695 [Hemibagrus guttatus]|nr:hypothetical protein QTP86_012695 [Hemibagrus guttatus]